MATIRKNRSGKYEVQVRRKGFSPVCRCFHNRADAVEWARHLEVKADRGELPTPLKVLDKHKVKDILKRYKDEISVKKLSHDNEKHLLNRLRVMCLARNVGKAVSTIPEAAPLLKPAAWGHQG